MVNMHGAKTSKIRAGGGSRRARLGVALAALALASGGAAGCSGEAVSDRIAEEVIEQGTGGDVDVDTSDGEVSIRDGEGNSVSSGNKLPEDFPVDDVPIVEGDVLYAVSAGGPSGGGWSVTITASGSVADVVAEAGDLLVGAGFERTSEVAGTQASSTYGAPGYEVLVTTVDDGSNGDATVTYVVQPR